MTDKNSGITEKDVLIETKVVYLNKDDLVNAPKYIRFLLGLNGLSNDTNLLSEELILYRESFPGNYTIEKYYSRNHLRFVYRLRFETPEDKTMFLLRYD